MARRDALVRGSPLLYHLEHVYITSDRTLIDPRMPVQWVIRSGTDEYHDYRGHAGTMASSNFRRGDEIMVLPSAKTARVEVVETFDGRLGEACAGESVIMRLDRDIDVSRGDMLCRPHNQPAGSHSLEAQVCWMHERPLRPGARLALKHTTRWARAVVDDLGAAVDAGRRRGAHRAAATTPGPRHGVIGAHCLTVAARRSSASDAVGVTTIRRSRVSDQALSLR